MQAKKVTKPATCSPVSADWSFHHLGVATRRIERELTYWQTFGYVQEDDVFEDPLQGVRGVFLTGPGPRIELLEALPGRTVLDDWVNRGIRIYHQAFEVPDIQVALANSTALGAKVIVKPVPSTAFGGRLIAFAMLPMMQLVEFVEASPCQRS